MKSISEYAVCGALEDNKNVAIFRIAKLLDSKDLLHFLVEGIPVKVEIIDIDKLTEKIRTDHNKYVIPGTIKARILDDLSVSVSWKYISRTLYFKDQKDADRWQDGYSPNNYSETASDEFPIEVQKASSNCTTVREKNYEDYSLLVTTDAE